jgi:hypothetical protein
VRKLSLSELANVAEIAGAIVIVASLAYIGIEMNQNTKALQLESYQAMMDNLIQLDIAIATDEDLSRIVATAESEPSVLAEDEWVRFQTMAYPRIGLWEFLFLATQEDALSDVQWQAFQPYYADIACRPGYRRFWELQRHGFSPGFQDYMEAEIHPNCAKE